MFVRRVTLDITGTLPDQKTYDEFMADASADKRAKLIDRLLERKEFTEMWVMKFAELLQIQTDENQGMSYKATLLYFNWLKDRIANNVPMDQIVRELLTSTGGTFVNPSTNYYQVERDGRKSPKRSSSFHGHADSMPNVTTILSTSGPKTITTLSLLSSVRSVAKERPILENP